MKRIFRIAVVFAGLMVPALAIAQQPVDPTASQTGQEPDLAAEVHQLKAEIERLSLELERVSSELEKLQSEHAAEEKIRVAREEPPANSNTTTAKETSRDQRTTARNTVPSAAPPAPEAELPTTVLVFQDGHQIEARNYAIVGQSLWVYTDQDSKKFPVTELNLEATRRVNSDRGVAFQAPPSR